MYNSLLSILLNETSAIATGSAGILSAAKSRTGESAPGAWQGDTGKVYVFFTTNI